jgi:hypothetical protein
MKRRSFLCGLNPNIRAMVYMWKLSSVAKGVEIVGYAEGNMSLNGGIRSIIPQPPRFVGKTPMTFSRGGKSRPHP